MKDIVERARAALKGISPGPWKQIGFGNIECVPAGTHPPVAKTWNTANGEFVAASPQLVTELVAELQQLRRVAALTVKSFRDVEGLQLYDAATHRCIDLLDEVAGDQRVGGRPARPHLPGSVTYYDAAYRDEDGKVRQFSTASPDLRAAVDLCESLNTPNPRKAHPDRVWFVAVQDRPDWQPLNDGADDTDD